MKKSTNPKKSTWNYRVLAFDDKNGSWLQVHEVYYKDGVPESYSTEAAKLCGSNIKEIKKCLEFMSNPVSIIGSVLPKNKILWGGKKFPQPYN